MCPELWEELVGIQQLGGRLWLSGPPSLWKMEPDWAALLWVLLLWALLHGGEELLLDSWWNKQKNINQKYFSGKCDEFCVFIRKKQMCALCGWTGYLTIYPSTHKAYQDSFTRRVSNIFNMRCPLHFSSLWWSAVIYYVCSQAASSISTPVNDFLHQPKWLCTTAPMNLIHWAAGYVCRWRQNSEDGGQVAPLEKKWVTAITQNTACLVAELLTVYQGKCRWKS